MGRPHMYNSLISRFCTARIPVLITAKPTSDKNTCRTSMLISRQVEHKMMAGPPLRRGQPCYRWLGQIGGLDVMNLGMDMAHRDPPTSCIEWANSTTNCVTQTMRSRRGLARKPRSHLAEWTQIPSELFFENSIRCHPCQTMSLPPSEYRY